METVENCLIFQQKKLLHNTIAHKVKASAHSFELSENLRILAADAFFFSGLALSVKSFGFASSPFGRGVTAGDGEGEAVRLHHISFPFMNLLPAQIYRKFIQKPAKITLQV